MAIGLGMIAWICLLFSPLVFVKTAHAQEAESYGTVIGIVSLCAGNIREVKSVCVCVGGAHVANSICFPRIWVPPTLASV